MMLLCACEPPFAGLLTGRLHRAAELLAAGHCALLLSHIEQLCFAGSMLCRRPQSHCALSFGALSPLQQLLTGTLAVGKGQGSPCLHAWRACQ